MNLLETPFISEETEEELGAFGSPGGKSHIVLKLLKLVPPHKTYIEPFTGGAALYWKKQPVELEVLNDLDPEIAHAYKFIKNLDEETINKVKKFDWKPNKEKFFRLRDAGVPSSDLMKFYKFFYVHFHSYGGTRKTFGYKKMEPKCFDKYLTYSARMKNTKIFNDDYGKVINKFDSPDTFIYLDPPYPNEWPGYTGTKAWGEKDVKRLYEILKASKAKWLLSINDLDWIRPIFKEFNVHKIMVPRKLKGAAKGGLAEKYELLISNYEIKNLDDSVENLSTKELIVEKRGNEYCVIHHHHKIVDGKDQFGTPIKCFPTKEQADAMHKAIIISEIKHMGQKFPGIILKNAESIWQGKKEPIMTKSDIPVKTNLYFADNDFCYGILKLKNPIKGINGNVYDFDIIDKFEDAKPVSVPEGTNFIEDIKFLNQELTDFKELSFIEPKPIKMNEDEIELMKHCSIKKSSKSDCQDIDKFIESLK
jgi:DNA adenine methylase